MRGERQRTAGGASGAAGGKGRPRTGDEALDALLAGNERFVRGRSRREGTDGERRAEIASEQKPFAIILGCSDSRVPPELAFDTGLGDLFVVRVAGNTAQAPAIVGSLEFAAMRLGSVLLMVLGHQSCGAVAAAVAAVTEDARQPGSISDAVAPIVPVVRAVRDGSPGASPDALVERSVLANIEHTASDLKGQPLLSRQIGRGELKVVGAEYRLDTGAVEVV
jgi:carbonic anhydrase